MRGKIKKAFKVKGAENCPNGKVRLIIGCNPFRVENIWRMIPRVARFAANPGLIH